MFITEEQSEERLNNPRNLANRFKNGKVIDNAPQEISASEAKKESWENLYKTGIQHRETKRPGNNRPWLSKSERTGIATEVAAAPLNEHKVRQKEIAEKYGVQISTVSDIAANRRRAPDTDRSVNLAKVEKVLDDVRERAVGKLMDSLDQLTPDKVSAHNAKDISVICANMARVVQQTIPQEKATQNINLVVYTPELRNEKHYDIVEVE